jgi:hypothetical protein
VSANVFAQRETPAGAGDKNLGDDGIKMRSVEMERIKREAQIAEASAFAPINKEISAKFPQIKEDFEGIQVLEGSIIKAYTTGKSIDYGLIESAAEGINKKAQRLDTNLFAATKAEKKEEKTTEKVEKPKIIRDLIVELDNAVGDFVSSKIFGNIKVIEPDVAIKTRNDLLNILKLSELVAAEAKKMK